jgi:hypothetical protein
MDTERLLTRLALPVSPLQITAVGMALLLGGYAAQRQLDKNVKHLQETAQGLAHAQEESAHALSHFRSLANLKTHDVDQFKSGLSTAAQSKKQLFEAGLSLQEERRLLEKQWEIMTTYLSIDTGLQRVFVMRGDQPLESYFINYVPPRVLGNMTTTQMTLPVNLPRVVRIISKERFANPERGTSEMVNGKLQWEPPQVGTSVRSNALGEYVLFTNSKLILHGPPRNETDHEAFPHICLGLSLNAARNLYQRSFIGTKILLNRPPEDPRAN